MRRRSACWGLLLLWGTLMGCNICQSPFDYASSVPGPDGRPNCQFNTRWGSAFAPTAGSPPGVTTEPTPAAAETPQPIEESPIAQPEPEVETTENDLGQTITR